MSIVELSLSVATAAVRLFQESAGFLEFSIEGVETAFSNAILFPVLRGKTLLILDTALHTLNLVVNLLIMFLKTGVGLIGVIKGNLEFVDIGLELLLQAKSLGLTLGFNLKRSLHGIKSSLVTLSVEAKQKINNMKKQ